MAIDFEVTADAGMRCPYDGTFCRLTKDCHALVGCWYIRTLRTRVNAQPVWLQRILAYKRMMLG
jgi:hypothetical protein